MSHPHLNTHTGNKTVDENALKAFVEKVAEETHKPVNELWELYKPYKTFKSQVNNSNCSYVFKTKEKCTKKAETDGIYCYRHKIHDKNWPCCIKCNDGRTKVYNSKACIEKQLCLSCADCPSDYKESVKPNSFNAEYRPIMCPIGSPVKIEFPDNQYDEKSDEPSDEETEDEQPIKEHSYKDNESNNEDEDDDNYTIGELDLNDEDFEKHMEERIEI